jgi:hypothetical protein
MAKTVAYGGMAATITATSVRYYALLSGAQTRSSTESAIAIPAGTPGTYSNLYARISTNTLTAASTFVFRKGGVTGTQAFSVGSGATGEFEDTTGSDAVVQGDLVCGLMTAGATGTSFVVAIVGAAFTATTNTAQRHGQMSSGAITLASTTLYPKYTTNLAAVPVSVLTALEQFKTKTAGTLKNSSVNVTANARVNSTTFGSLINGVAGNLAISVATLATGSFTDVTHTDAVVSGDLLGRYLTLGTGVDSITPTLMCNDFVTTDGSFQHYATLDGQTTAQSATVYEAIDGLKMVTATESTAQSKAGVAGTLSLYEVYISANTITAASTMTSRKNTAAGNGSISITGSTTGWFEDVTHSDTIVSTDEINWKIVGGAGGTSMAIFYTAAKLANAAATIITTQPSNVASGAANSPSPVAKATTDGTTIDSGFVGNCVVSIASGSGVLSGTLTVACIAGVATFANIIITGSGAHTLTFTMPGYATVTSSSFTVSAGGGAPKFLSEALGFSALGGLH